MNELNQLVENNTGVKRIEYKENESHIQGEFTQEGGLSVGIPYDLQKEGWEITHVLARGNSDTVTVHFRKND